MNLMSISKSKNLDRRLSLIAEEATSELNKVCDSSHWQSLGFLFFDQLDSQEKIAKANYYYGQLKLVEELKLFI